jgi:hypothetical protein
MLKTLERTEENVAPKRVDNPLAFFRALPLALGVSLLFWGCLAGLAYGLYELVAAI